MMEFKNGDEVQGVVFADDTSFNVGTTADKITVIMENGQMAGVPWFEIWKDKNIISKWNGALISGVLY